MPEAIATTKRKFHKLLDTLSSYANAPVEPQTPLTARQKLEQASERVRKRQKQDGSLSSIESRLKSVSTTSLPHKVPARAIKSDKELPNFSPWSYERFSQRLQTFSKVSLWHPKPERIDEVAWAKRGWSCVEVNTVACVGGCNRRVIVQTAIPTRQTGSDDEEEEDDTALEEALTARYEDEITNGHSENCLWRKAGCKDDIYRMQVVRPAVWQPALKERYSSLLAIHSSVQDVKIKADIDVSRLRDELGILPPSDLPTEVQDKALHIAMQGWHGCSELGADLLRCNTCFQRIGLWMYQPGYRSKNEDDDEALLDLSAMHREYCPWRSAKSQQATGSLEGLSAAEILLKVVQTYIREKRRKTEDYSEQENIPEPAVDSPKPSREEVEQADKERETRLQRLKRMLSVKKTPKS